MKGEFKYTKREGLPKGANEVKQHIEGQFSIHGYKADSPDVDNPFNIIPSGDITMKGVDFPVHGVDNLGNSQIMYPGNDYKFPGSSVFETPLRDSDDYEEAELTDEEIADLRAQGYVVEEYQTGGPTEEQIATDPELRDWHKYNTPLTEEEQKAFKEWKVKANIGEWDRGAYDIQGYWKDQVMSPEGDIVDAEGHRPDTYKKPNHPTFSTESKYANEATPGYWDGPKYYAPATHKELYGDDYYAWMRERNIEDGRPEHLAGYMLPEVVITPEYQTGREVKYKGDDLYEARYMLPPVEITGTPSFAKDLPYYDYLKPEEKEWLRKNKNSDDAITRSIRAQAEEGYGIDGNPTYGQSAYEAALTPFREMGTIAAEETGIPAAYRIAQNPMNTLEGLTNTALDLQALPITAIQAMLDYDNADLSTNPLTGNPYGSGLVQTGDALTMLPAAGFLGAGLKKGAKYVKPAKAFNRTVEWASPAEIKAAKIKAAEIKELRNSQARIVRADNPQFERFYSSPDVRIKSPLRRGMERDVFYEKASPLLEDMINTKIARSLDPRGKKLIINQEKEYLESIGVKPEHLDELAEKAYNARIKELETILDKKDWYHIHQDNAYRAGYAPPNAYTDDNFWLTYTDKKPLTADKFYTIDDLTDDPALYSKFNRLKREERKIHALEPLENSLSFGDMFLDPRTVSHELAHVSQASRRLPIEKRLREAASPYGVRGGKLNLSKSLQEDYDYFIDDFMYNGKPSRGGIEPYPFAHETKQLLLDKGIIKDWFEPITEETLFRARRHFDNRPSGIYDWNEQKFSSDSRMLDFTHPSRFKMLAKELNKIAPAVLTGTGTALLADYQTGGEKLFTDTDAYLKAMKMYNDSLLLHRERFLPESASVRATRGAYDRLTAANKKKPRVFEPKIKPVFKEVDKDVEPKETTKVYKDKAEYNKAMQMYNDSLGLYTFSMAPIAEAEVEKLGYLSDETAEKLFNFYDTTISGQGHMDTPFWHYHNRLSGANKEGTGAYEFGRNPDPNYKEFRNKDGEVNLSARYHTKPKQKPIYDNSEELKAKRLAEEAKRLAELKAKQEKFSSIGGSVIPVVMAEDTNDLRGYKFRTKYGEKFVSTDDVDTLKQYSEMYGLEELPVVKVEKKEPVKKEEIKSDPLSKVKRVVDGYTQELKGYNIDGKFYTLEEAKALGNYQKGGATSLSKYQTKGEVKHKWDSPVYQRALKDSAKVAASPYLQKLLKQKQEWEAANAPADTVETSPTPETKITPDDSQLKSDDVGSYNNPDLYAQPEAPTSELDKAIINRDTKAYSDILNPFAIDYSYTPKVEKPKEEIKAETPTSELYAEPKLPTSELDEAITNKDVKSYSDILNPFKNPYMKEMLPDEEYYEPELNKYIGESSEEDETSWWETQKRYADRGLVKYGTAEASEYATEGVESEDVTLDLNQNENLNEEYIPINKNFYEITKSNVKADNPEYNFWSYVNQFDGKEGFDYVPIKNKGNSVDEPVYKNVKGVAHFLLDTDLSQETPYQYSSSKAMIRKQLDGKSAQNMGSTVTDFYFPVYEKKDDGTINIKYLKKDEIEDVNKIAAPLRQYKFTDFDWDGETRAQGFNNTVASLPTKKSYVNEKGIKTNASHLIFSKNIGKNAYGRYGGGSFVLIAENKEGQRVVLDVAGSINQVRKTAEGLIAQLNINPEELTIGYHDVGSFSAKPQAKNNELKYKQWNYFNNEDHTGGGLAIPAKKTGGNVFKSGGEYMEAELTPEEINWYLSQGYRVDELE